MLKYKVVTFVEKKCIVYHTTILRYTLNNTICDACASKIKTLIS